MRLSEGTVKFYGKNLSRDRPLITQTVTHNLATLQGSSELQIGDGWGFGSTFSRGLFDEVRLSRGIVPEEQLLVNLIVPEPSLGGLLFLWLGLMWKRATKSQ